jgi:hypothetical protein
MQDNSKQEGVHLHGSRLSYLHGHVHHSSNEIHIRTGGCPQVPVDRLFFTQDQAKLGSNGEGRTRCVRQTTWCDNP